MIEIKIADLHDMDWVNSQYDKVGFVHSNYNNEIVLIACCNGEKAGLGRLVRLDDDNYEMGGIYTLDEYRGAGIAAEVVQSLVKEAIRRQIKNLYCLPFSKLEKFYYRFGFRIINDCCSVPEALLKKHNWCINKYEDKTLLMKMIQD